MNVMADRLNWMWLISVITVSAASGLELTFYSGVYGTCIGAMTQFGRDAKSLIGISGICIGIGEIVGELSVLDLPLFIPHVQTYRVEQQEKNASGKCQLTDTQLLLLPSLTLSLTLSDQEGASLEC